jgi:hypothetical protein
MQAKQRDRSKVARVQSKTPSFERESVDILPLKTMNHFTRKEVGRRQILANHSSSFGRESNDPRPNELGDADSKLVI